jgi:hypothetical protein
MKAELEVLNKNIVVQGCTFSRNALRFDVVDERVLAAAGACLQEMGKAADWWWGDYLVAWADWKITEEGAEAEEEQDKEKRRRFWVRNHASVLDGSELADTQWERYALARFYNCTCRQVQLSKKHHEEAMWASHGDLSVAQDWLDKAAKLAWSANQLRAEIRAQTRKQVTEATTKTEVTQQWLFDARMGASAQIKRVADMDDDEAEYLLAQLAPIVALAQALALKVSAAQGGGGKESIATSSQQR